MTLEELSIIADPAEAVNEHFPRISQTNRNLFAFSRHDGFASKFLDTNVHIEDVKMAALVIASDVIGKAAFAEHAQMLGLRYDLQQYHETFWNCLPKVDPEALDTWAQVMREQHDLLGQKVVDQAVKSMGGVNILFNNHAYQMNINDIHDLSEDQWEHTFDTNIHRKSLEARKAAWREESNKCCVQHSSIYQNTHSCT